MILKCVVKTSQLHYRPKKIKWHKSKLEEDQIQIRVEEKREME